MIDVAAAPDVGGEVPPPPPPPPRPKKVPKEKVPKAPREPKPPKPAKTSVEGGHSKADSLFMQFARLERDVWNQDVCSLVVAVARCSCNLTALCVVQVVVASLISLPKIELHHKAILGRLAYEIKQRQQCISPRVPSPLSRLASLCPAASGRPQKNTFVTTTLDLVNKLVSGALHPSVFCSHYRRRATRRTATETNSSSAERV